MDLLTLLPTLENNLTRTIVGYNGDTVISYTGDITSITVNSTDTFTEVYQILLTPDVKLHINHHKNTHLTTYKISDITTFTIT